MNGSFTEKLYMSHSDLQCFECLVVIRQARLSPTEDRNCVPMLRGCAE